MALLIWTALNLGLNYWRHQPLMTATPAGHSLVALASSPSPLAAAKPAPAPAKPIAKLAAKPADPAVSTVTASVSPTVSASTAPDTGISVSLISDSTGQMLPPIPMAPSFTYRNNYSYGQCTYYVAGRRRVPSGWGNAANWLYAARVTGWTTGHIPAVGAIAWTPAGAFGHVALVEGISADYTQIKISEMNYYGASGGGFNRIDNRWTATDAFQYIY